MKQLINFMHKQCMIYRLSAINILLNKQYFNNFKKCFSFSQYNLNLGAFILDNIQEKCDKIVCKIIQK